MGSITQLYVWQVSVLSCARYGNKLSFTSVPDIEAPGAFDDVVNDVDGVIHAASPYKYPVDDNERDLFHPAVNGTLRILEAVHASGNKRIKRVVITSSFAAVVDTSQGLRPGKVYTERDWNPMTWDEAKAADGSAAYCASKGFAEKAAWDFVELHQPYFSITALCPPMVYGPNAYSIESIDKINTSSKVILNLINGSSKEVPPTGFPAFANAHDLGLAHRLALETPGSANKRYLITTGPYSNELICDLVRAKLPDIQDKVPVGRIPQPLQDYYLVNNDRASKELGIEWTSLEDTITAAVENLLHIEKEQVTLK